MFEEESELLSLQDLSLISHRERLLKAIHNRDVEQVKQCVKLPRSLLSKCLVVSDGNNPLYLAIEYGDIEIIKQVLLTIKDDPEALSILVMGTINNDTDSNSDNSDSESNTSEHNADRHVKQTTLQLSVSKVLGECEHDHYIEIIEQLLLAVKEYPDVFKDLVMATNKYGENVLHRAVKCNGKKVIEKLLTGLKNSPEILREVMMATDFNQGRRDILHTAARWDRKEIFEKLLTGLKNSSPEILVEVMMATDNHTRNILQIAAEWHGKEIIDKLLIEFKNSPEFLKKLIMITDKDGNTALSCLIHEGYFEIVKQLLNSITAYPDVFKDLVMATNKYGENILNTAFDKNNIEVIEQILLSVKNFPEVIRNLAKSYCYDEPFLYYIIYYSSPECIKRLVDILKEYPEVFESIATAAGNKYGETAFHLLVKKGYNDIVTQVLDNITNPEVHQSLLNIQKEIHLLQAAKTGNIETVQRLLEHAKEDLNNLMSLIIATTTDGSKQTALHLAVKHGHSEVIKVILDIVKEKFPEEIFKSLVTATTDGAPNKLLQLAVCSDRSGRSEIIEVILDIAKKELPREIFKSMVTATVVSYSNKTILQFLVEYHNIESVQRLLLCLKEFPEVLESLVITIKEYWRKKAILLAYEEGYDDVVQQLLCSVENHPEIHQVLLQIQKGVQLRKAAKTGDLYTVEQLLNSIKEDPWLLKNLLLPVDSLKETALHHAAAAGYSEIVEQLLSSIKEYPELLKNLLLPVDSREETALHHAATAGHSEIVEQLLSSIKEYPELLKNLLLSVNRYNKTVLSLAIEAGHLIVIEKLLNYILSHFQCY